MLVWVGGGGAYSDYDYWPPPKIPPNIRLSQFNVFMNYDIPQWEHSILGEAVAGVGGFHINYNLNSLKGGYMEDYIYRGLL